MMAGKNRFGFDPLDETLMPPRASRDVGPMGAAVRETAASLSAASEALIGQRRQNAADAQAFRDAAGEGRVLEHLPLDAITGGADAVAAPGAGKHGGDLPRDRLDLPGVAVSDAMDELKASIRARGQKEPIEVFADGAGYRLKKGFRRLTALRQLFAETDDARFSRVIARVVAKSPDRIEMYIDMVEENVIREDLTFAEMAHLALEAARDPALEGDSAEALVGRLYASLHKMKRSYIRSFVALLETLGPDLKWPKAVPRNLGVEVARRLKEPGDVIALRLALAQAGSPEAQTLILGRFAAQTGTALPPRAPKYPAVTFRVGGTQVAAQPSECRLRRDTDFATLDRALLERAVAAFDRVIDEG